MTDIVLRIKLPSLSFPRQQTKVLLIGVLVGVIGTGVVYDLFCDESRLRGGFEQINASSRFMPLTETQKQKFKEAMEKLGAATNNPHRLRVVCAADCFSCAKDADALSRIINGVAGWQVVSLSSQIIQKQPRRMMIEAGKKDPDSRKGLEAFKGALRAAHIPFATKEGADGMEEAFTLSVSETLSGQTD